MGSTIRLNIANGDMVDHSNLAAARRAVSRNTLARLEAAVRKTNGVLLIQRTGNHEMYMRKGERVLTDSFGRPTPRRHI